MLLFRGTYTLTRSALARRCSLNASLVQPASIRYSAEHAIVEYSAVDADQSKAHAGVHVSAMASASRNLVLEVNSCRLGLTSFKLVSAGSVKKPGPAQARQHA